MTKRRDRTREKGEEEWEGIGKEGSGTRRRERDGEWREGVAVDWKYLVLHLTADVSEVSIISRIESACEHELLPNQKSYETKRKGQREEGERREAKEGKR